MAEMDNKCKARVYPKDRWGLFHPHQCHKSAVKDGFCTIHHPDYAKAKSEILSKKWQAESAARAQRWRLEKAAPTLLDALQVIHPKKDVWRTPTDDEAYWIEKAMKEALGDAAE